tara:strand:+ start:1412 stop:2026 length:615 start_codon:yes stop_codon:yes gene_type:complete
MDTFINQIQQTSTVEWLGTVTGIIGVYLSIKEKALAWAFFIICYGLYVYLSFSASLFAAMALNACFIPIAIYGWWQWSRTEKNDEKPNPKGELQISSLSATALVSTSVIAIVGTIAIGTLLTRYTEGADPYLDAFATTMSIIAQWMLGRKYIQNWIAWITADLTFVVLWGSQGYWLAVAMFLIFTALAVYGYVSWKKEMHANAN